MRWQACQQGLASIARDPREAVNNGAALITDENPHLAHFLGVHAYALSQFEQCRPKELIAGAAFTYHLLKTHIELQGGQIPEIATSVIEATKRDQLDQMNASPTSNKFYENAIRKLTNDPEYQSLAESILEMGKYRSEGEDFLTGAYDVTLTFKALHESRKLADSISDTK